MVALREIKNQTFGNQTKKLLYLRLGIVSGPSGRWPSPARHRPPRPCGGRGGELCLRHRGWRVGGACCWRRGAPYAAPRPPRRQGLLPSLTCFLHFVYACWVWRLQNSIGLIFSLSWICCSIGRIFVACRRAGGRKWVATQQLLAGCANLGLASNCACP